MSLLNDEEVAAGFTPENYQEGWEYVCYSVNKGFKPKNFPEGSTEYSQFSYSGRKKADKALLESLKNG